MILCTLLFLLALPIQILLASESPQSYASKIKVMKSHLSAIKRFERSKLKALELERMVGVGDIPENLILPPEVLQAIQKVLAYYTDYVEAMREYMEHVRLATEAYSLGDHYACFSMQNANSKFQNRVELAGLIVETSKDMNREELEAFERWHMDVQLYLEDPDMQIMWLRFNSLEGRPVFFPIPLLDVERQARRLVAIIKQKGSIEIMFTGRSPVEVAESIVASAQNGRVLLVKSGGPHMCSSVPLARLSEMSITPDVSSGDGLYNYDVLAISPLPLASPESTNYLDPGMLPVSDHSDRPLHMNLRGMIETQKRVRAQFKVAIRYGHEYMVVGNFGCGAYRNSPEAIANIFKMYAKLYEGTCLKVVVIAKEDFFSYIAMHDAM